MIIIQLTGLSGAGKSTLAELVSDKLKSENIAIEVLDGDIYRNSPVCSGLGFSDKDRKTNLERLFQIGMILVKHNIVVIIAAINPFEDLRNNFSTQTDKVKTVWIKCDLETLIERDTKGLYKKAMLPDGDKDKVTNFTGISSAYDNPTHADLTIETSLETIEKSAETFYNFITDQIKKAI